MGTTVHIYRSDGNIGYHLNGDKGCLFGASHPDNVVRELTAVLRDWGISELKLFGGAEASTLGAGSALSKDELSRIRQALIAEGFVAT